MRVLHLDSGRQMRGGQWQSLRLHEGLLERGVESVLLRGEEVRPLRLGMLSRSFDVVHAHDARSHTFAALFSRVPFVVSRRVAFPVRDSVVSRWKYRKPAMFLAVSRFVAGELRKAGVSDSRIRVVYDAVPLPERLAACEDILVLPHKGQEQAEAAGLPVRVTKDLAADLPHARALLYLSESEGLGSGILLAMAHGVPVAASRVGGIPEIVQDGVNGVFAEGDLREALARLNDDMRAAARRTVEQRFTIGHMVDATVACYREVLA